MSLTLYYQPVTEGESLPSEIRRILEKRYPFDFEMNTQDVTYLAGLRDAGVNGADTLIESIEKHGKIRLWYV